MSLNKGKPEMKTLNSDQEFELIASCHFKNLISLAKTHIEQSVESNFVRKFKPIPSYFSAHTSPKC